MIARRERSEEQVEGPIILIDDVLTLGGHLRAACWTLASPWRLVSLACTVAHHLDKPVSVQQHTLDLARLFQRMPLERHRGVLRVRRGADVGRRKNRVAGLEALATTPMLSTTAGIALAAGG